MNKINTIIFGFGRGRKGVVARQAQAKESERAMMNR